VPGNAAIKEIPGICDDLQPAYLLISPLQGLINNLATMWGSHSGKGKDSISENEMKLAVDPTLALFADDDGFVSIKKLRPWAEKLSNAGKGGKTAQFKYTEVAGAGHFWHDYEAIKILQEDVKTFVREL
jgi:pimeloyl-ACP methyl ester carboxylesterase